MSQDLRYPLSEHAADQLHARSGRPLSTITQQAAAAHEIAIDDIQVSAETLRTQAAIAEQSGYPQLAANLIRAAELTAVPNGDVLRMYEMLRPRRATYDELLALADRLEHEHNAPNNATLVREAAEVYLSRDLVRK